MNKIGIQQPTRVGIDRTQYKNIKKFNRQQLEVFANNIYKQGYEEGQQQTQSFVTDIYQQGFDEGMRKITQSLSSKIMTALKNTKGIGQARFDLLIKNITEEFMKGKSEKESSIIEENFLVQEKEVS